MIPASALRQAVAAACLVVMAALPAMAADIVHVANVSRTLFSLPLWIAMHKGFMKAEGLEATSSILDSAEKINAAIRSGEMHIAMGTPEAVIVDAYRGGTLRIIAGNTGKLPHFIIAKPQIKTLQDLKGANFGILSDKEGSTYVVQDIMKALRFTPADYKMTAVGGAPTRWRLLKEGKIDAGLQPFPLSYEAEAAGFTNLGSVIPFVPEWQFTTINADIKWAEKNRGVVVRFLRAVQRGRDFMNTDRDESARIAAEELKTTVALAGRALDETANLKILDPNLALSEPGLRKVFQTLQQSGDIDAKATFDVATFADLGFWKESRTQK
jgi:NitT/TauT family transport system substrate-binding protein